jgi:proteasome beta subunit
MVVIPIFAGYDTRRRIGRIYNYDVTGGTYEEMEFHATGSGGTFARALIKQRWRPDLERAAALQIAVAALFEAADEDSATGGPDAVRGIYPTVATITAEGYSDVTEDEIAAAFGVVVDERRAIGPVAGAAALGPGDASASRSSSASTSGSAHGGSLR